MHRRRGFAPIILIVIVAVVTLVGGGAYYVATKKVQPPVTSQDIAEPWSVAKETENSQALSPEEVLARGNFFHNKEVQIGGKLVWIPFADKVSGLGGASPGFVTQSGNITVTIPSNISYFIGKEVVVRGIYNAETHSLHFGSCADCLQLAESQAAPVDTRSWKTYRNEQYGFEFRYPVDWNVKAGASSDILAFFRVSEREPVLMEMRVGFDGSQEEVGKIANQVRCKAFGQGAPCDPIPIKEVKEVQGRNIEGYWREDEAGTTVYFPLSKKDKHLEMILWGVENKEPLFREIVATFQLS